MNQLESLKWRYATKVFDKNKKIQENDLQEILEAFRLSPSAYGLQPWKIILVEDKKLREQLLPNSWNQSQVVDASHLLVLARIDNPSEQLIEDYLEDVVKTRNIKKEDLEGYANMMKGFLLNSNVEQRNNWADRQVSIALGNLLTFLAFKKIDSCPMEGLDRVKYDEILGLKELGLATVYALPIGYRSQEDRYEKLQKVRFPLKEIFIKK